MDLVVDMEEILLPALKDIPDTGPTQTSNAVHLQVVACIEMWQMPFKHFDHHSQSI